MLSCWRAYGDPLYAVNHHTRFYRSRMDGTIHKTEMPVSRWLREGFAPAELARTGIEGVTTFPFRIKWMGLDHVSIWLRRGLRAIAALGLLLLLFDARGRLLLVALVTSLLPFAFTWRIPGGNEWRFTMHAYPFYLVAAMAAWPLLRGYAMRLRPASLAR
jgi:hypothetical protein